MPNPRHLVAFVGQNENGILRHLSEGLMSLLAAEGYEGHVLDLGDAGWAPRLGTLAAEGIAMAWGHAGVGARLEMGGKNLWSELRTPFVSVLADPPCWMPANHAVASPFVANAYLYREWLAVQRRFIQSPQLSAPVEGGLVPNPLRNAIPWRERPHRMVLVKTGDDPAARRAGWATMPRRWRGALEDAAGAARTAGTGDVTPFLLDALDAQGIDPEERTELTLALMRELDLYVRDARSTALVRALLPLPVDIFGRGWDHVSGEAARARFHPAFDAAQLPELYAGTQFLLNTTPNFASGVHERVAYGLDARCCVVSDGNAFMRERLAGIPTLFTIDPHDPALSDRLAGFLADGTDWGPATEAGVRRAAAVFDGRRYMLSLLDLATEVRALDGLGAYRV